jgi:hypothetical protein
VGETRAFSQIFDKPKKHAGHKQPSLFCNGASDEVNKSFNNVDTSTTNRMLDREAQAEHVLEVRVSDNGVPPLNSTTRVIVQVSVSLNFLFIHTLAK